MRSGQLPAFYEFAERSWTTFNAKLVKSTAWTIFTPWCSGYKAASSNWLTFLEAVPADDFDRDYKVRFNKYKVTISRLLRAELGDERSIFPRFAS